LAIVPLGPLVLPRRGVDQLDADPQAVARLAYAPFENMADPELPSNRARVDGRALETEGAIARDYAKRRDLRKLGDQVFSDSVAEIFLLAIAAHVDERQHANRRCSRSRGGSAGRCALLAADECGDAVFYLAPCRRVRISGPAAQRRTLYLIEGQDRKSVV